MPDTVNLCMVGCGAVSEWHCDGIDASGGRVRVTAAVDCDATRAGAVGQRFGARAFASLDAALAHGGFEAVLVLLPHDLHEAAARTVFDAGLHLLLEKPIGPDLETSRRIMAAGREADTVFMVGENAFYWPEVAEAARRIDAGEIGEPLTASSRFMCVADRGKWHTPGAWRFDQARVGGGIVVDGGSHWIRPLRMWMGDVVEVAAAIGQPFADMQGESQAHALMRFASGRVGSFEALLSESVLGDDWWFRITGTQGTLVLGSGVNGKLRLYDADHPEGTLACEPRGYTAAFSEQMKAFADAILEGVPLPSGPEDAFNDQLIIDAIYRAAESRRWESVG